MTNLSGHNEPGRPLLAPLHDAWTQLGIGRSKLLELIAAGEIETVKIGRRRLVVQSSVTEYVERLRASA